DVISLGFRVDNVRWAPDGTLFVAGQGSAEGPRAGGGGGAGAARSVIGKVDVKTMTYKEIIDYPASGVVSFATVVVQVGDELWAGSSRGDRISRYPASGVPK